MFSTAQIIQYVIFLLILFVGLSSAVKRTRSDILAYDSTFRIALLHVLVVLLVGLVTVAGAILIVSATYTGRPYRAPFGFALMLPLSLIPIPFIRVKETISRIYERVSITEEREFSKLEEEIRRRCQQNEISIPEVLVSPFLFFSPQVLGLRGRCFIVFPKNYFDIVESVGMSLGSNVSRLLHEFTLKHEIAHLKNHDYQYFTWLSLYLRLLFRVWLPTFVVTALLVLIPQRPDQVTDVVYAFTPIPALNVGLLYVLSLAILRDRELTADQSAIGEMTQEETGRLTVQDVHSDSPLQVFFRMFNAHHRPMLGVALFPDEEAGFSSGPTRVQQLTSRFVGFLKSLFRSHPPSRVRCSYLLSGGNQFLLRHGELENGLFLGLTMGLANLYWHAISWGAGIHVSSELTMSSVLLATTVLTTSAFLPTRHASAIGMRFEDYDSLAQKKLLYAAGAYTLANSVFGLPFASVGGFPLHLRFSGLTASGSYVFYLLVLMFSINFKLVDFPQTRTFWRIAIRVMVGLIVVAVFA
jgi:Zn-dependent protease with chaperone function